MESNVKAGGSEEWFDVVNNRDEVVGKALRRDVHANGWWHRAVHVLVFDHAGRVFLQKRSMKKDLSPGLWDSSCSGHLDSGEDYDAAAMRELGEEIGVFVKTPPARWFRIEACVETGWEFVWVYRLTHDGPFVLHPDEIETGSWFTVEEVSRWMKERPNEFCPSIRLLWHVAVTNLQPPTSNFQLSSKNQAPSSRQAPNTR
jgi:isopentenyl-diphosphate delta-isomerase